MTITVNSYFSGAGLMDIGLLQAGITINQAFELDAEAVRTYQHNLGNHVVQCDLSQELVLPQQEADGMVFTYPCNKYSKGSDIHGERTGEELFLHALRHIALAMPLFYVVENVPGMKAFPIVMEAMSKLPTYHTQVFCPVQAEHWLPQRRDRLMIFATVMPHEVRPPAHVRPVSLCEIVEDDPDVSWTNTIRKRMTGGYRDKPIVSDPAKGDIAPTAVAHYAKDISTRLLKDDRFPMGVRPYSVREYARLQGVPDWFDFPVSTTSAYRQIGNGVPVDMGQWAGEEMVRYMKLNHDRRAA